jgi:hypothetical protein
MLSEYIYKTTQNSLNKYQLPPLPTDFGQKFKSKENLKLKVSEHLN